MRSTALLLILAPVALAAAQDRIEPLRLVGEPRHAGTYDLATGTWTRHGASASLGPDVIYNASRPSGYFAAGFQGVEWVDEGILPGTANPNFNGPQDAYLIDGFELAYCSLDTSVDLAFTFYDSFQPCTAGACTSLASTVTVPGLPAGGCWIVTINLAGGNEFCLEAEGGACNPGYQGANTNLDHFGWGFTFTTPNGATTGPIMAGADPNWAPEGEGTCYLPTLTCASGPTAAGARDVITEPSTGNCYGGGYFSPTGCGGPVIGPFAQLHMVLFTDCTQTCKPYTTYCDGGPNQLGTLSVSTNVLGQNPVLTTTGLTGGHFAYHLIGNGMGVVTDPPGSLGDMCLGGSVPGIGRYVADVGPVVGGVFSTDLINGNTGGGVGMLPNPPGGVLLFGDTWNFQTWTRISGSSRFSDAIVVKF